MLPYEKTSGAEYIIITLLIIFILFVGEGAIDEKNECDKKEFTNGLPSVED